MSKPIRVPSVRRPGRCPVRPKLDGSQGNPMAFCKFDKGHRGKHSWQLGRRR